MSNDVLMDYDAIENLVQHVNAVSEELNNLIRACEKAAVKIETEGLVNRQGERWADQLRSEISPYLQRQMAAYEELAIDLQGALDDLHGGDVQARSRFS
jgi:prefoldin subunit 5